MIISKKYRQNYETIFKEMAKKFPEMAFDSSIPSYIHKNRLAAWLFWKRIDYALELAMPTEYQKTLDIGCGSGVLFQYLQANNCYIVGCDPVSRKLAEFTCDKLNISAAIYDDVADIPDGGFDCIFALDVLEHVENIDDIVKYILRLSNSGTKLIVSGPTENIFYKMGRKLAGFSGEYHVHDIYDVESRLAEDFTMVRMKKMFLPLPLFRVSHWQPKKRN